MPTATDDDGGGRSMGRRTFIRGIGATAAAGAGLAYSDGPVGSAEALLPSALGVGAGAAIGEWLLREFNPFGASSPDSGLTPSALKQDVYTTARTRKSTNKSTFVDNRNIIQSGLANTLYVEGKLAAIEKLNNQAAKADVETAAQNALAKYVTTIEKNLIKSWNESVRELANLTQSVSDHPDTSASGFLMMEYHDDQMAKDPVATSFPDSSITLSDGTDFTIKQLDRSVGSAVIDPFNNSVNPDLAGGVEITYDSTTLLYLDTSEWGALWSDLQTTISNVQSGLTTWVNNAYDQVQSGAIEVQELITPRERAAMMAEDGGAAQAIADLQALNIPVDVDNQATVSFSSTGATLRGTLAMTDPDGQTLEPGTTYDPSADTWTGGSLYLTYDVSTGQGDWSAYTEGVDGGVATFGQEPYENTTYRIDTSANETVSVNSGNFTPVNSTGAEVDPQNATAWSVDLSDKLEQDITNITGVRFFADVDETQMETIRIQQPFTLEEIRNTSTDETQESMTFESTQAQDDTNYITREEWESLEQKNEELIQKYEESQESDSLLGGIGLPGLGGAGATAAIGGVAVVGVGLAGLKKALDIYLPGR